MTQNQLIEKIEAKQMKPLIPSFKVGDTLKVSITISEGGKERVQVYEGTVVKKKGRGIGETVRVYRVHHGHGTEKTFLVHSPKIQLEVTKRGVARKASLRRFVGKVGKAIRVQERFMTPKKAKEEVVAVTKEAPAPKAEPKSESEEKPQADSE
ncbi:MAG: hypothetical protein S4CHLAM102_09570 [Chlamydiia bacterium]|nr:hypothetical protein [Chlamydiia bacterium]